MSVKILIVATRYDLATDCLYAWAEKLRRHFLKGLACDACVFIDGEALCASGSTLSDTVERADCVVFFGHGKDDQWIALPENGSAHAAPLVDSGGVGVLKGRKIYAACCDSLSRLGPDFANAFQPDKFIGYANAFNVHLTNEAEFEPVVRDSIVDFLVNGTPAPNVASRLQAAWTQLDNAFSAPTGHLPWVAAACAKANATSAGFC